MAFVIDQLYAQNLGCGSLTVREIFSRILENQLLSWVLALPESLQQVTLQTMQDEIDKSGD